MFDSITFQEYIKLVETLHKRYQYSSSVLNIKEPFDCNLINCICEEAGYLLVKGPYSPNHNLGNKLLEQKYTRIQKTHIQLCIRDQSIIKKREVYY